MAAAAAADGQPAAAASRPWYRLCNKCIFCDTEDYSCKYGPRSLLLCSCCPRGTHVECIEREKGITLTEQFINSGSSWFCSKSCEEISDFFERVNGKRQPLRGEAAEYSLEVVRYDKDSKAARNVVEAAKGIFKTAFEPLAMANGLDLVEMCCTAYESPEPESNDDSQHEEELVDYSAFRVVVLRKASQIVSVATLRVFGSQLAEMPFVATRQGFRRAGHCRRLIKGVEAMLRQLQVAWLVLPSIRSVLPMWRYSFSFLPLTLEEQAALEPHIVSPDYESAQLVKKAMCPPPDSRQRPPAAAGAAGAGARRPRAPRGSNRGRAPSGAAAGTSRSGSRGRAAAAAGRRAAAAAAAAGSSSESSDVDSDADAAGREQGPGVFLFKGRKARAAAAAAAAGSSSSSDDEGPAAAMEADPAAAAAWALWEAAGGQMPGGDGSADSGSDFDAASDSSDNDAADSDVELDVEQDGVAAPAAAAAAAGGKASNAKPRAGAAGQAAADGSMEAALEAAHVHLYRAVSKAGGELVEGWTVIGPIKNKQFVEPGTGKRFRSVLAVKRHVGLSQPAPRAGTKRSSSPGPEGAPAAAAAPKRRRVVTHASPAAAATAAATAAAAQLSSLGGYSLGSLAPEAQRAALELLREHARAQAARRLLVARARRRLVEETRLACLIADALMPCIHTAGGAEPAGAGRPPLHLFCGSFAGAGSETDVASDTACSTPLARPTQQQQPEQQPEAGHLPTPVAADMAAAMQLLQQQLAQQDLRHARQAADAESLSLAQQQLQQERAAAVAAARAAGAAAAAERQESAAVPVPPSPWLSALAAAAVAAPPVPAAAAADIVRVGQRQQADDSAPVQVLAALPAAPELPAPPADGPDADAMPPTAAAVPGPPVAAAPVSRTAPHSQADAPTGGMAAAEADVLEPAAAVAADQPTAADRAHTAAPPPPNNSSAMQQGAAAALPAGPPITTMTTSSPRMSDAFLLDLLPGVVGQLMCTPGKSASPAGAQHNSRPASAASDVRPLLGTDWQQDQQQHQDQQPEETQQEAGGGGAAVAGGMPAADAAAAAARELLQLQLAGGTPSPGLVTEPGCIDSPTELLALATAAAAETGSCSPPSPAPASMHPEGEQQSCDDSSPASSSLMRGLKRSHGEAAASDGCGMEQQAGEQTAAAVGAEGPRQLQLAAAATTQDAAAAVHGSPLAPAVAVEGAGVQPARQPPSAGRPRPAKQQRSTVLDWFGGVFGDSSESHGSPHSRSESPASTEGAGSGGSTGSAPPVSRVAAAAAGQAQQEQVVVAGGRSAAADRLASSPVRQAAAVQPLVAPTGVFKALISGGAGAGGQAAAAAAADVGSGGSGGDSDGGNEEAMCDAIATAAMFCVADD